MALVTPFGIKVRSGRIPGNISPTNFFYEGCVQPIVGCLTCCQLYAIFDREARRRGRESLRVTVARADDAFILAEVHDASASRRI